MNAISCKMQVFADYCVDLYKSSGPERKVIDNFLDSITIPRIMGEHLQSLDRTIMVQKIDWAISRLKIGRSPGLDELTAKFYKSFRDQITPYLSARVV